MPITNNLSSTRKVHRLLVLGRSSTVLATIICKIVNAIDYGS